MNSRRRVLDLIEFSRWAEFRNPVKRWRNRRKRRRAMNTALAGMGVLGTGLSIYGIGSTLGDIRKANKRANQQASTVRNSPHANYTPPRSPARQYDNSWVDPTIERARTMPKSVREHIERQRSGMSEVHKRFKSSSVRHNARVLAEKSAALKKARKAGRMDEVNAIKAAMRKRYLDYRDR